MRHWPKEGVTIDVTGYDQCTPRWREEREEGEKGEKEEKEGVMVLPCCYEGSETIDLLCLPEANITGQHFRAAVNKLSYAVTDFELVIGS